MTDFEPLRAQREIVAGAEDVHKVVSTMARDASRVAAEAEANANALMKIERFAAQAADDARAKLKALEQEAERAAGGTQQ